VLVIGASGGCGSAGVQLAKALGAREVVGVCSGKNAELVRAQGADRVVDYQTQRLADEAADYDVVYDTATSSGAGENYRAAGRALLAPATLERRPQYMTINGGFSVWLRKFIGWEEQDTHLVLTDANTKDLEELARMADGEGAGKIHRVGPDFGPTFRL
jgi:NADPH:quinone reductase-like Zn-dependent oxidoreductase